MAIFANPNLVTLTVNKNGNTETTICTMEDEHILVYNSKVPNNGWWIENSAVFNPDGIVATLRNLNKTNMTTTKYYKKTS